jgi:hypothetical protein
MNANDSDFDNRKNSRRKNLQQKTVKKYEDIEYKDSNRIKKQFKRDKEFLRQEELWEEWEDEIS